MNQPDPDAELHVADRIIALIGAMGYMHSEFPGARMEWGSGIARHRGSGREPPQGATVRSPTMD